MNWWTLLAQATRPEELGRRFRGPESQLDWGDAVGILAFVAVAAALLGALHWLLRYQGERRRCFHPGRLFQQLCRLHQLDRHQRRLLWQLAQARAPEHPGTVFVVQELWDIEHLRTQGSPGASVLVQIYEKIFGVSPAESPQLPDSTDSADPQAPNANSDAESVPICSQESEAQKPQDS